MSGPKNFINRVKDELINYELCRFDIINPSPLDVKLLNRQDILKVGRLDGAIYYKATSRNVFNLIRQRRERFTKYFQFLNYIPKSSVVVLNNVLNSHLNRFSRIVQKKSNIVVFQSDFSRKMQDFFVGEYYKNRPFKVILNGVPTNIFNPSIESISLEGNPKLVITASFRLHKRLQDAVRLINFLKIKYPNVKLHVLGDMDNLTKSVISSLDTDHCIFHGRVASELLPKFYNACDVGLSPSMFDPCPNSVIEMMACGLPVISVLESGASELVEASDLLIKENLEMKYYELQTIESIPRIDVIKWSKKVEQVLDNKNKYDELMLERIEKELDIKIVAKKYANFIKDNSE